MKHRCSGRRYTQIKVLELLKNKKKVIKKQLEKKNRNDLTIRSIPFFSFALLYVGFGRYVVAGVSELYIDYYDHAQLVNMNSLPPFFPA